MSIQSHFCNLIWWIMSKAQIDENVLKNFLGEKFRRQPELLVVVLLGQKPPKKLLRLEIRARAQRLDHVEGLKK